MDVIKVLTLSWVTAIVLGFAIVGCTDAQMGKIGALGGSADVTCYSGGEVIYKGVSTGKVISEKNSDGYFFVDANTKRTMEVSGNCVIIYKK